MMKKILSLFVLMLTVVSINSVLADHTPSLSSVTITGNLQDELGCTGDWQPETDRYAVIHYFREDGDYGDYTTGDFNDFWGLHDWTDAAFPNSSWDDPVRWDDLDIFGPVFRIDLVPSASQPAYIIHRGDTKDPGPDQFLSFDPWGYEVWQLEGEGPDPDVPHYVLPVSAAVEVNHPPTIAANEDMVEVEEGGTALNGGLVNDTDGDTLTLSSSIGNVIYNNDNTWIKVRLRWRLTCLEPSLTR
jgi:hypothetical protein